MPMLWMFEDYLRRQELFIVDCPTYDGTLIDQLAVFFAWGAFYTYLVLAVLTLYTRTMFHAVLWAGVALTSFALCTINTVLPHDDVRAVQQDLLDHPDHTDSTMYASQAVCAQHPGEMLSPEAALVAYAVVYFLGWHVYHDSKGGAMDTALLVWLLVFTSLTVGSLLYLELYMMYEVVLGFAIGAIAGTLAAFVNNVLVVEYWDTPVMGKVRAFLFIKHTHVPT